MGGGSGWAAWEAMSSDSQPVERVPMSPLRVGIVVIAMGLAASGRGGCCWRSGTGAGSTYVSAAATGIGGGT